MIPELDISGSLPVGIHECTMEELKNRYGYNIKRNDLLSNLEKLVLVLKKINSPAIYIDGSFVTNKSFPKDIDLLWDEGSGTNYEFEQINAPEIFDKKFIEKEYGIDLFPANIKEGRSGKLFLSFFQEDRDGNQKGILKINLF